MANNLFDMEHLSRFGEYARDFRQVRSSIDSVSKSLGFIVGFIVANYTTFCPYQINLNIVDERVKDRNCE